MLDLLLDTLGGYSARTDLGGLKRNGWYEEDIVMFQQEHLEGGTARLSQWER